MSTDSNLAALAPRHPPQEGPLDRRGISIFNVVKSYGLENNFYLGAALYHLLLGAKARDPLPDLQAAYAFVEAEMNSICEEPTAGDGALAWAPPDVVAAAYGVSGYHADAIRHLLEICAYALDDEVDEETGETSTPLEFLSDLISFAIDEHSQKVPA